MKSSAFKLKKGHLVLCFEVVRHSKYNFTSVRKETRRAKLDPVIFCYCEFEVLLGSFSIGEGQAANRL